jgi:hypothetical protein
MNNRLATLRTLFACAVLLCACNQEPYPVGGPDGPGIEERGEAYYASDPGNHGQEIHDPDPEDPNLELVKCSDEEHEKFRASNKHGTHTDDIGLLGCWRKRTVPAKKTVPAASAVKPAAEGAPKDSVPAPPAVSAPSVVPAP